MQVKDINYENDSGFEVMTCIPFFNKLLLLRT